MIEPLPNPTGPADPERGNLPDWANVIVVMGTFLIVGRLLVTRFTSEERGIQAVVDAVGRASEVQLDGKTIDDPTLLLLTLRLVDHPSYHHSAPTARRRIELANGDWKTTIVIARDSQRPNEFWVFWPVTDTGDRCCGQPVGFITSSDLAGFLQKRDL